MRFGTIRAGGCKRYLTFQIASEYARTLTGIKRCWSSTLCPQANASSMLLGGIIKGEDRPKGHTEQCVVRLRPFAK